MTNKQSITFCLKATENGEPISWIQDGGSTYGYIWLLMLN